MGPLTCWRLMMLSALGSVRWGVTQDEGCGGKDLEIVVRPPVGGQPSFHVSVELLTRSIFPCRLKMQSAAAAGVAPTSESPA